MKKIIKTTVLLLVFFSGVFLILYQTGFAYTEIYVQGTPVCASVDTSGALSASLIYPNGSEQALGIFGCLDMSSYPMGSYLWRTWSGAGQTGTEVARASFFFSGYSFVTFATLWNDTAVGQIKLLYPANGDVSASTTVGLLFSYNLASSSPMDTYNVIVVDMEDNGVTGTVTGPIYSTQGIVQNYMQLPRGHAMSWSVLMTSSSTENRYYSISNIFSVEVSPLSATSSENWDVFKPATTTLSNNTDVSALHWLSFLNVPTLLKTKAPFAYIPMIYSVITYAIQNATSTPLTSGTFNVGLPTHFDPKTGHATATTTLAVAMFSKTTIQTYLSDSWTNFFRAIMVGVTYAGTAWFLFHDIKRKKII